MDAAGNRVTGFRALVADDEPLARRMVAELLRRDEEIESVVECDDPRALRDLIARHRPDILFLDIEMPEVTGLDIAADLSPQGPVVVFVTAFNRYASQAFEVEATDYVLKPFTDARFAEAVRRAKRRVRQQRLGDLAERLGTLSSELRVEGREVPAAANERYLTRLAFKQDDRTTVVKTADVLWIEAEDYYVRVHSTRGRHLLRASLSLLETRLDPREFLRVHRAALVNVEQVRELREADGLHVVLSDGAEVPISRSRRGAVEAALLPRLRQTRG